MSVSSHGKIPWRRLLHGIHDMPAPEPTSHIHLDLLRDATSDLFDVSSFIDLFRLHRGVRHFQRSCQTSSTPWRHLPRRPETAMRPHWWSRRRRWTRCGKFGEAFGKVSNSVIIIHHSSFIIHHSLSINILDCLAPIHFLPPTPLFFFGFGLPFQGGGTAAAVPGCHHAVGHSQDQT